MTDDQTTADDSDVTAVAAAVTDGAYTLFVADFDDTDTAWQAYEALQEIEDGRHVAIDGVIVVKRDADGKLDGPEGDGPQHEARAHVGSRRGRRPRRHLPAVHHRQRRSTRCRRSGRRQGA